MAEDPQKFLESHHNAQKENTSQLIPANSKKY
jgi:hypothetical protein